MKGYDTSRSIWQGKRVRLRALEPADWEVYFAWNQDDGQARALYEVPLPRSQEWQRRWAERQATEPAEGDDFRFAIENEAGEWIGDLSMHHCDPRAGTLSYGITIRRDARRQGYASEAIALGLRYYFTERRYQKATVGVYSFNDGSIRLHEQLGFQREGCIRRATYTEGRFFDLLLFGLTREEFMASPHFADLLPAPRPDAQ